PGSTMREWPSPMHTMAPPGPNPWDSPCVHSRPTGISGFSSKRFSTGLQLGLAHSTQTFPELFSQLAKTVAKNTVFDVPEPRLMLANLAPELGPRLGNACTLAAKLVAPRPPARPSSCVGSIGERNGTNT